MSETRCTYTRGDARCVFGPNHSITYHHLNDGTNATDGMNDAIADQFTAIADDLVGVEDGLAAQFRRQAAQLRGLEP